MTSCVAAGGAPIIIRATERKNFDSSVDFFFSLRHLTAFNFLQRFYEIILEYREEYKECTTRSDGTAVAQEVVRLIRSRKGRFVDQGENGRWFVLSERDTMKKVYGVCFRYEQFY